LGLRYPSLAQAPLAALVAGGFLIKEDAAQGSRFATTDELTV